ncbi:MAG: hypothetical protein ACRDQW_17085 [Haloechinothrix sp.]
MLEALQDVLEESRLLTPDLGGSASTAQVGEAVADRLGIRLRMAE